LRKNFGFQVENWFIGISPHPLATMRLVPSPPCYILSTPLRLRLLLQSFSLPALRYFHINSTIPSLLMSLAIIHGSRTIHIILGQSITTLSTPVARQGQ
jgi:hypothetical protein